MKDYILSCYGLPLLRLSTKGSNEKEKVTQELDSILAYFFTKNNRGEQSPLRGVMPQHSPRGRTPLFIITVMTIILGFTTFF